MTTTITAKITKAEIAQDGQVSITVELKDEANFTWTKSYSYYTTQTIDVASFKKRIVSDLKKDLAITRQLEAIKPLLNKPFTLSI